MTSHCSKNAGPLLSKSGFWPGLLSWSFKTDPIFSRFFGSKNHITRRVPFRWIIENFMIFHVLALLPPGLVDSLVSTLTAFLPPCDFDIGATFLKVALWPPGNVSSKHASGATFYSGKCHLPEYKSALLFGQVRSRMPFAWIQGRPRWPSTVLIFLVPQGQLSFL